MTAKTKKAALEAIELEPDAWPRFERFIRDIAKAGPQHRTVKKPSARGKQASQKRKETK
jgi:hypothetical protein